MLKKLLKYDFRALKKTLLPLNICVFLAAIFASLMVTFTIRFSDKFLDYPVLYALLMFVTIALGSILCIAILSSIFISLLLILARFYKHLISDEGYLSFTLPVTVSQHLVSKLLSGIVWMIISVLTVLLSMLVFVFFGTSKEGIINISIVDIFKDFFTELFSSANSATYIGIFIELIFAGIIILAGQMLIYYLAIVIGGVLSKKHKIITAIGVYLGINMACGIVTSLINIIVSRFSVMNYMESITFNSMSQPFLISFMAEYAIFGIGAFLLSKYFLTSKLNLE